MLLSAYILLANFQDTSIKPEGGHTNAAGTKAVDLERQVLADELKQAGYEL